MKFAYFIVGISLPVVAYAFWPKIERLWACSRRQRVDEAHDLTVEDSFPASDPPSAW